MFNKRFFFTLILILTLGKLMTPPSLSVAAQSEATPNAPIIVEAGWELAQTVAMDTPSGGRYIFDALPTDSDFEVNTPNDQADANLTDDICDSDLGLAGEQCSLRAAIEQANSRIGADTILFNLPVTGSLTIQPSSPLPTITEQLTIDGSSQSGAACPVPAIELDGSLAGTGTSGLSFTSSYNVVQGLVINRFAGNGITIPFGSYNNVIRCNYIGTNSNGTADLGNGGNGISIEGSQGNVVGGTAAGDGNLLSGNDGHGLYISGSFAPGNLVQGNKIGTNALGSLPIGNSLHGIFLFAAAENVIGGTSPEARNTISGNDRDGIQIRHTYSTANLILGNYIGLNSAGTFSIANSSNGIEIADAPQNIIGGTVTGAGNVIAGNLESGVILTGTITTNTVLQGNLIGTDGTGFWETPNLYGIELVNAINNTIGGTASGAGNLISGNSYYGIMLLGASDTTIQGNKIGTDLAGEGILGNFTGVWSFDSADTVIGGSESGAGNLISGNREVGVYITGNSSSTVQGNNIGTNWNGSMAVPNGHAGYAVAGIRLFSANSFVLDNLISGNNGCGVELGSSGQAEIQGNLIGTNSAGTVSIGNTRGICIYNSSDNLIGGLTPELGNLISGNEGDGISLNYVDSHDNLIYGNKIGTDLTGTAILGNGGEGVELSDAPSNWVGGTAAGMGNLISGNGSSGILISGVSATNNTVQANFIGTNISGTLSLGNEGSGVYIFNAPNNLIGGTEANAGNLISGNESDGIFLYTAEEMSEIAIRPTNNTIVQGNTIGTDLTGEIDLGNESSGISILANDNLIGGTEPNAGNLISGNNAYGIGIFGNNNQVYGNFIGTNRAGTTALGNSSIGVTIVGGSSNLIGGTTPQHRNLISGNAQGMYLYNSATANLIQGNFIGTDLTGELAIPNTSYGIELDSGYANTIGGSAANAGNLISGNGEDGILISFGSVNTLQGNTIGLTFSHANTLPNQGNGILMIITFDNLIGGTAPGEGNWIAGNIRNGIAIVATPPYASSRNSITGNAIYNNGWLGIDLSADGVTANDAGDPDGGANNQQNYPTLAKATVNNSGITTIEGLLFSTPSLSYTLHFYANSSCETFGYGEGESYLGSAQLTTNANGVAGLWVQLPVAVPAGQFITATATDSTLNTSEFSNCTPVLTNLLTNPGFESGSGVGWTEYPAGIIGTTWYHAGSYSAEFCGSNNCTETIKQSVTVPTNGQLSYWWYLASQDSTTTSYDYLLVQAYDTNGQLLATLRVMSNIATRNQWRKDTLDLSSLAGQTIWLRFTTITNSSLPTVFYIDDVSVH